MDNERRVLAVIKTLLDRRKIGSNGLSRSSPLYRDGLGLDSLGAAELSVMLEMEFGADPYTEGEVPRTVAQIIDFFDRRGAKA
jgi:acyl carrier protein